MKNVNKNKLKNQADGKAQIYEELGWKGGGLKYIPKEYISTEKKLF